MNHQSFALISLAVLFSGLPTVQIANVTISEREPNDEQSQRVGEIRLNQMIEVAGAFKVISDAADHYNVNVVDKGSLTVRLQSVSRLFAKVYRDNDRSGTVSPADFFIGTVQSGQSLRAHQSGEYVVQVFKPPNTNGFPTYNLLFVNQK